MFSFCSAGFAPLPNCFSVAAICVDLAEYYPRQACSLLHSCASKFWLMAGQMSRLCRTGEARPFDKICFFFGPEFRDLQFEMLYRRASLGTLGARAESRPYGALCPPQKNPARERPCGWHSPVSICRYHSAFITSTGPVLQCRPRWQKVGIGQRVKLRFPHGRVPRTPSPVFPLPALPAEVFRLAVLPAQPASFFPRPPY